MFKGNNKVCILDTANHQRNVNFMWEDFNEWTKLWFFTCELIDQDQTEIQHQINMKYNNKASRNWKIGILGDFQAILLALTV